LCSYIYDRERSEWQRNWSGAATLEGEVGGDGRDRGAGGLFAARPVSRSSTPRAGPGLPAPTVLAIEDLAEGGPEVRVEDGVDDRVEQAVEIAEPADDADDERRQLQAAAVGAERTNQRHDEERQPTADERPSDDRQGPRRFTLPLLLQTLLSTLLLHIHTYIHHKSSEDGKGLKPSSCLLQ